MTLRPGKLMRWRWSSYGAKKRDEALIKAAIRLEATEVT
jgi:hypothetical protein